jgi:hypothetical protein
MNAVPSSGFIQLMEVQMRLLLVLTLGSAAVLAFEQTVTYKRRGVKQEPGKH